MGMMPCHTLPVLSAISCSSQAPRSLIAGGDECYFIRPCLASSPACAEHDPGLSSGGTTEFAEWRIRSAAKGDARC